MGLEREARIDRDYAERVRILVAAAMANHAFQGCTTHRQRVQRKTIRPDTEIHLRSLEKKRSDIRLSKRQKHTTGGIPRWSPTLVLVARFSAYVWQSGRDAQFSLTYGRMCYVASIALLYR